MKKKTRPTQQKLLLFPAAPRFWKHTKGKTKKIKKKRDKRPRSNQKSARSRRYMNRAIISTKKGVSVTPALVVENPGSTPSVCTMRA